MSLSQTLTFSPEEIEAMRRRLDMALCEAGWPNVPLTYDPQYDGDPGPCFRVTFVHVPIAVWWAACRLAYGPLSCWSCFNNQTTAGAIECANGNCQDPDGPKFPPSGLLRRQ
jgi:hypothetical protein